MMNDPKVILLFHIMRSPCTAMHHNVCTTSPMFFTVYICAVCLTQNKLMYLSTCLFECVQWRFPLCEKFSIALCEKAILFTHTNKHMHMLSDIPAALPTILDLPAPRTHTEGEQFELVCTFTGIPAPQIRWEKDNHVVTLGEGKRIIKTSGRSQLEINNLTLSDAGVYTCLVSNVAGMATRSERRGSSL